MNLDLYFDIDGVLNTTPQLGGRLPWMSYSNVLVFSNVVRKVRPERIFCISFHRGNVDFMETVKSSLGFNFGIARFGEKMFAVDSDRNHLIIDDDLGAYKLDHNIFVPDGRIGLTDHLEDAIVQVCFIASMGGKCRIKV